ncbi:hypothetical protein HYPSUDRAFT_566158 [Hypholoma sublateritium FD-334 SS-4]|uniref:HNH nuclease domain-containing protein n=1 Tax=Hypholoma sublateritium (strain FD-334 SS-4) TaxID=945553 RepID=A0A0D2P5I2_HYPSF|nr:hypothetical protein HYPSUDRAFT_566158 [Hypholoma sublateritium FD-334 SS-4]
MVTGKYDSGYAATLPVATLDALFAAGSRSSITHLAHIFPSFASMGLNPEVEGQPKSHYSSTVWGIINCFAHINVLEELDGPQIHSISNVLTLSANMHNLFDNLMLWFEEVPNTPNSYHICSSHLIYLGDVPNRLVTFTTKYR